MGKHGTGGSTTLAKFARATYRTGVAGVFGGLAGAALYLAALAPADTYAAPMGPVGPSVATPQAPATSTQAPATTSPRKPPRVVAQKPLSTSKRVVPDATATKPGSSSTGVLGATPANPSAATDYRRPAAQVNGQGDKVALAKCAAEALEEVPGDPNVCNWYRDLLLQQCIARFNG